MARVNVTRAMQWDRCHSHQMDSLTMSSPSNTGPKDSVENEWSWMYRMVCLMLCWAFALEYNKNFIICYYVVSVMSFQILLLDFLYPIIGYRISNNCNRTIYLLVKNVFVDWESMVGMGISGNWQTWHPNLDCIVHNKYFVRNVKTSQIIFNEFECSLRGTMLR